MSTCLKPDKRAALLAAIWNPERPKLQATIARERRQALARGEHVPLTAQQVLNQARRAERIRAQLEAAR